MNLKHSIFAFSLVVTMSGLSLLSAAQESKSSGDQTPEVLSGPQIGETVPGFEMTSVFGEKKGEPTDVVKQAGDKPLLLIFFHEKTRPAFGLMRTLAKFSETREKSGLTTAVCFLTKDPTETTQWVNQVTRHLPKNVQYGVFAEGMEGPGSFGLNRNVALTILVANKGKVVHNSALIQPSLEADSRKIVKAIVEITGGGEVPDIKTFIGQREMVRTNPNAEPNMRPWLAPVIKQGATNAEVDEAATALEAHCKADAAARNAVGRIANTVVNSGKLENYGTLQAQDYLAKWAKEYSATGDEARSSSDAKKMNDKEEGEIPDGEK